ncbi:MAG: hypothetical protein NTZ32_21820 [Planctomycetales bacterium]|nr:hypothetical protein [Planctomycetales bacterium]
MTTFEEAYDAAASWLDERGLLLNSQLLQMVTGDEGLRDEVRAMLLSDGVAIDRYGIGLVRGEQPLPSRTLRSDEGPSEILFAEATDASLEERFQETGPVSDESAEAEWWLMAGGATRGPFMLEALQRLRRSGDVADTQLVRQGERGLWRSPHDVEELAEFAQPGPSEQRSLAVESPVAYRTGTEEPFTKDGRSASLSSSRPSGSVSRPDTEPRRSEVERRDGSVPRRAASPAPEPSRHAELNGSEGSGGAIDDECEFFLWEGGRPVGPVSRADLQERLANGLLLADEFVQVGVDGEWQPVAKALNVRRPPLKNSDRSRDTGGEDSKSSSHSSDGSNSTTALNNKGLGSPVSTTGAPRAASRKTSPSANSTSSPIDATTNVGRAWQHTAAFVGSELRLRGIAAGLVVLVALVVWLRQPPAASTIYREFTQYHTKLNELRTKRTGPTDWKQATSRDQQRVQTLLDGLKQRASAARPIEQQLMWAGRFGLVELFKRPTDPAEFERLYDSHMSQAKRLLEGGKAQQTPPGVMVAPPPTGSPEPDGSPAEAAMPRTDEPQ